MTTIFEEEIRSQGDILRQRAQMGRDQAQRVATSWSGISYALVGARGSSDNAAIFFQYLAGKELGLMVALATPSLYEGDNTIVLNGAGVLAISQSGRSPGIGDVLQQARTQHRPTAVITNDVTSSLAMDCDVVINLAAGVERAIASTKTFSTSWHALAQLVEALKGSLLEGLDALPDVIDRTCEWALSASLPIRLLNQPRGLTVVGRGVGFAVASEISLKIREVTGIRSEAYSAPDFAHGPIGADGAESTLLLIVTPEMTNELCALILDGCHRTGMGTVVLRSSDRSAMDSEVEIVLDESLPSSSLGLAQVIVGQVLALRLGEVRGRPIDTSPGLNKITLAV
jgi:glucosamine--fructose-6-phosphate aminotransferase (isomerizing)